MRNTGQDGRLGTTPPVPGRPTTFFLGLLGLCALLFALVTWQVAADGPLRDADERLGPWITGSRLPDGAAEFLADLGGVSLAVPVLAVAIAYAAWRGHRAGTYRWWLAPLVAAVAMAAVPALVIPLKELFDRTGPPGMDGSGYYPSGHTATAMVAYGGAALLLLPYLRGTYARRELVIACALLNFGVGLGLVRRGYHWPLDVVASWCLFGIVLQVMVLVVARYGHRATEEDTRYGHRAT
ncbi:membrane protein [Streptomyces longisporoflavus]|uniref:phosphatase PAP2 family protein n=1 Tax=Streptomyces longisporoflavus TaxID=28044 RepID=UPI0019A4820C|nr:phosphatase PAP2 family protein [Streptomyces longisporoflavus]GGV59599.1 membrane protein [Streptomyces longisporoflavus]